MDRCATDGFAQAAARRDGTQRAVRLRLRGKGRGRLKLKLRVKPKPKPKGLTPTPTLTLTLSRSTACGPSWASSSGRLLLERA